MGGRSRGSEIRRAMRKCRDMNPARDAAAPKYWCAVVGVGWLRPVLLCYVMLCLISIVGFFSSYLLSQHRCRPKSQVADALLVHRRDENTRDRRLEESVAESCICAFAPACLRPEKPQHS